MGNDQRHRLRLLRAFVFLQRRQGGLSIFRIRPMHGFAVVAQNQLGESFMATLKTECFEHMPATRNQAQSAKTSGKVLWLFPEICHNIAN
jgi:hypothetical protein